MTSMNELRRKSAELAPIDPNVQVPAAIRAAAARSEALHKQAYNAAEPPKDTNGQDGKTPETQPATPAATPAAAATPPAPAPTPAPAPATPAEPDDWQHKYNSMKGRYDRAENDMRGLNAELERLRNEVNRLKAAPPAPAPVVRTNENTFAKVTQEDRDAFGDDFLSAAARAARQDLDPMIASLKDEIASLKGQVGGVVQKTAEQTAADMYRQLDAALPNWRNINRDTRFIAWTNLRDPYSGATRISMMKDAHVAGDADRLLAFFKGFLSDEATVAPAETPATPAPRQATVPLETLAAPGRAKTSASQVQANPDEKETISRAQVLEFYRQVNRGAYRGREAEKNALEQRIFAATNEGRIVG